MRGTRNCYPVLPTLDPWRAWPSGSSRTVGGFKCFKTKIVQDRPRSHSWYPGLDDQFAELKAKGISIERTTTSDYVKTATVTDPAGTGRRDFRLTKNGVPGERAWNDVSIVDVATCTVADRAKIGDSPWERCTGR